MLLYGMEIWTISKKDTKSLTSVQMTFFSTLFFTTKRTEKFLEEMKVEPVKWN